ncbi:YeiH family protein [Thalassospira tepidiphila]|uniref:Membrane protein n=2 Tax=Thalassospira tepidiphila TaxID=393657 RepID=A0A853KXA6_9PROT|nr:YeiH family protein [Thalassospira tepidiphila]NJB76965.1 putative integral membrane protein (TIGR00698 family) [Thalassospira tepidiphila]OAZ09173.1 membrane protein [Thalassospira tepidiphila MCCC 1A03514]
MFFNSHLKPILPGLAVTILVALAAKLAEHAERMLFGRGWVESLVFAILIGVVMRSVFGLAPRYIAGVRFCAKTVLEIAIVLLGASISAQAIGSAGGGLVAAIIAVVCISLFVSYHIGRALGLSNHLSMLVACGNSICGNSAIAATAPVIEAQSDDVAASISFTAVLGVLFVFVLPMLHAGLGLSATQYGIFSGLTVYAVPQVLAATAPAGTLAVQVGTLVKLIRVLMLGPVIFALAVIGGRARETKLPIAQVVPWFIIGFIAMMGACSFDLIPDIARAPIKTTSSFLTILAMAALGLSVDIRNVLHVGGRVVMAALLSLMFLCALSGLVLVVLA